MANEAFAHIKTDQFLKDAEWYLTDGLSARFEYPFDDGGKVGHALFCCQVCVLAVPGTKRMGINLSAGGTRKVCCANA
ncbi:MAG: hypothetical protein KDG54_19025 [Geminicoccaceae bacterium]|nr:hypothetical protein [Geminicoccaceae bacterium]